MQPESKRTWWIIGLSLVFAFVVLAIFWFGRDTAPPNDADLLLNPAPIPDSKNAYVAFSQLDLRDFDLMALALAQNVTIEGGFDYRGIAGKTPTLVAPYLKLIDPPLNQAAVILESQSLQWPDPALDRSKIPHINSFITLSKGWYFRAQAAQAQGRVQDSLADLKRLLALAHLLNSENATGIIFLTSQISELLGFSVARDLINDPSTPPAVLKELSALLPAAGLAQTDLALTLRGEYTRVGRNLRSPAGVEETRKALAAFDQHRWDAKFLAFNFRPNQTLGLIAGHFRHVLAALGPSYESYLAKLPNGDRPGQTSDPTWRSLFNPNGSGQVILQNVLELSDMLVKSAYKMEAINTLLRAGLAVRLYWDDHHALPPTLNALVPQYLPAVPTDPFNGHPLRYDASRAILWSIGDDVKDSGGFYRLGKNPLDPSYEDPLSDSREPTLELHFAKPPPPPAPAPSP